MNNNTILEVDSVSKLYYLPGSPAQTITVLNNISFNIARGESMGIMGFNGSGKSSLLKILSGITKPDKGKITYRGKLSAILDLGFGIVPEITGRENIYLAGSLDGLSKAELRKLEEEIIDFADIGNYIDMPIKTYSSGMYLRLAFALKTVLKPDILLLDEVMTVGDAEFQLKCKKKIDQLKGNGASLVVVSHDLGELVESCNNCLLLQKGHITHLGPTRQVVDAYNAQVSIKKLEYAYKVNDEPIITLKKVVAKSNNGEPVIAQQTGFAIHMEIDKAEMSPACDVVLYVNDFKGMVLSDSLLFRQTPVDLPAGKGQYEVEIQIPGHLFSQGTFNVTVLIGHLNKTLIRADNCCNFVIVPQPWEMDKIWNNNGDYYPFRPKLNWLVNKIQP